MKGKQEDEKIEGGRKQRRKEQKEEEEINVMKTIYHLEDFNSKLKAKQAFQNTV